MARTITKRPPVRAAGEGLRAGEQLASATWRRGRDLAGSIPGGLARTFAALLGAAIVGGLVQYFLDRQQGRRRRHLVRERTRAVVRQRSRDAARRAKYLEGVAEGVAHKAAHAVPGVGAHREPPDDVTLAQKIESIAFRQAGVPKEHVSVNAENGVIYLRGQLERDEQIAELVRAVRAIEDVKGVKNLLHTATTTPEEA